MSKPKSHENPLVPHKKLRQIYIAMVEARLLDEHIENFQRGRNAPRGLNSTRGQEACRVSTAIELNPGDMISDSRPNGSMGLLLGATLESLLQDLGATDPAAKDGAAPLPEQEAKQRQLPWIEDAADRLKIAIGAAIAFKALRQTNIVVAYVYSREVPKTIWRELFSLAANLKLPIIFVILPSTKKKTRTVNIGTKARAAGIPAIPTDTNDAIALYRVAQESIGHARAGDGPAVIECNPLTNRRNQNDPISQMKDFLIKRKVCSETWVDRAGDVLRRNLQA